MQSIHVPVRYSDNYGVVLKNKFPCKELYIRCLVFFMSALFVIPLVERPIENLLFLF